MSTVQERIAALAAEAAETGKDMTQVVKGGGTQRRLPVGYAMGRLVEYHEFGKQPQEFKGVVKDPAMEVRLGFALYGEGYANEDGTPYIMRTFNMALSQNEKAKAFLLFKSMNWKGLHKHFAQMMGEAFLVPIIDYTPAKTATNPAPEPRSIIDTKTFIPPLDPVTKSPYPVPPARDEDFSIFLWDHPTLEDWDAMFIEGTNDKGKSKNYLQDMILSASDFEGSALQILLSTNQRAYKVPEKAAAPVAPATPATPAAAAPALPNLPAAAAPALPASPAATPAAPATAGTVAVPTPAVVAVPAVVAAPAVAVAAPALPNLPSLPQAA